MSEGTPPSGRQPILELSGIGKTFGGVTALTGVDFALLPGEVHGLVGENGAGKSTLMKIIAGVHAGYDGEMRIDGRPVHFRSARDALAAGIGMVHQELSIVPSLSVAENVFLGHQPTTGAGVVRWRAMAREAKAHLQRLGIDVDPAMECGRLPLGLQQLVELGRVLFSGARIIILDEPTSALSPPEIKQLFAVLHRLKSAGTSFIFISHFLEDVLEVSDRVTVFRNSRRIATEDAAAVDKHWVIERMIGRGHQELEEALEGEVALASDPMATVVLDARGLGRKGAFADVSLQVRAGEVLGLYGYMGSGQLEIAKALMGKLVPELGSITLDGQPLKLTSTSRAKRAGIALVPESRRSMLFAMEPVYKNISISILERTRAPAAAPRRGAQDRARPCRRAQDPALLGRARAAQAVGRQPAEGGAGTLADPPAARPGAGRADPRHGRRRQGRRGQDRARAEGARGGVVVASAEPETVLALADRIMVLRKGTVTREFTNEMVSKDRLLAAA